MNFNISVLYNPPSHNVKFYDELNVIVKKLDLYRETVWYGDYNINWSDKNCKHKLKVLMTKFNYQQIIVGPTRITRHTKTLIDLAFTNRPERIIKIYNLITGLSDHNMTLTVRKLTKKRLQYFGKPVFEKIQFIIPKSRIMQFERELKNINWEQIMTLDDVEECCNSMTSTITNLMEKFTKKIKPKQKDFTVPWINNEIRILMKKRDLALKTSLGSKLNTDLLTYRSLRNKVVSELRKAKVTYYTNLIDSAKGNNNSLWRHLNNLTNKSNKHKKMTELNINGNSITDCVTMADEFNSYFVQSVEELTKEFRLVNPLNYPLRATSTDYFYLKEVSDVKVAEIINKLPNSKSDDIFRMNSCFLRKYKDVLVKPLTHLVNLSIRTSTFPSAWKQGIITPVFKSGSKDSMSNYRPISILPVLSKIIEKVVVVQLSDHLEARQLLHPHQFGCRQGYSTEIANCCLIENVKKSLDKGNVVGAVFIDLKKAFDTVNHSLLLSKMLHFNFSNEAVLWFTSYLQSRVQCVKVDQNISALSNIKMGIPQGSILGPVLFSLFINDLPLHCSGARCQLYADDAVIYAPAKSPEQAAAVLSTSMLDIQQWLIQNQLVLNFTKTVSMCFSIKKLDLKGRFNVNIQNKQINPVTEFKYLGLVLDPQLKFDKHIKKIFKTTQSNLNCFKLIRSFIPHQAALLYMHAMIFSHISYCMTAWAQATPTATKCIRSVYNRAIKIMDKKPIRHHHCII